jgi:hypothetical protein
MDTPAINAAPIELPADTMTSAGNVSSLATEDRSGAGTMVGEKRAEILANRSKDPGVIVDVPQEPTAEEVRAAKMGEGMLTPAGDGFVR